MPSSLQAPSLKKAINELLRVSESVGALIIERWHELIEKEESSEAGLDAIVSIANAKRHKRRCKGL
jgi:hypothetical protein